MSYKKSKQIHDALKKLGIEITPADNAPVWPACKGCGPHSTEPPATQGWWVENGISGADYSPDVGFYCEHWEDSSGDPEEIFFIPDYTNASNALRALREIERVENCGLAINPRGCENRVYLSEWDENGDEIANKKANADTDDEALFKLLLAALELEDWRNGGLEV